MKHRLPFEILYEDRDVIVIDKPAGMLTTHTKVVGRAAREAQLTAENILNDYVRKGQLKSHNRVWLVHRLDRETSGVMMFAKSEAVAEYFRSNWNELTEKTYVAKVQGEIKEAKGVYESYLQEDADGYRVRSVVAREVTRRTEGVAREVTRRTEGAAREVTRRTEGVAREVTRRTEGVAREVTRRTEGGYVSRATREGCTQSPKFARTEWKLLSPIPHSPFPVPHSPFPIPFSLVEVSLKSGRKNQIRVHFSEAGHPVIGDVKYGGPKSDRLYLHALRLRFKHPHTSKWLEFSSPSPF